MNSARVIGLNNRAVTMLSDGQHKGAMNTLRLALENFYFEAREAETGPGLLPNQGGNHLMEAETEAQTEEGYCAHVNSVEINMQLEQADPADDDHMLVFNRAMVVSDSAPKHVDVTLVSILYNLALVSHLVGLQTRSEARFRMALRFYGMAYEIIQRHDDKSIFDDLLILALVNNLGHTQRRLGNLDDAKRQSDFLRSSVGLGSDPNSYSPQVNEIDYVFFYLNALEERVSAPAA
jgi:hypothetical protein